MSRNGWPRLSILAILAGWVWLEPIARCPFVIGHAVGNDERAVAKPNVPAAQPPNLANGGDLMGAAFKDPAGSIWSSTLGGRQFWGDVHFFHHFRIQKNVFTGHYRLLDSHDRRLASGTLEDCKKALAEIRVRDQIPAMSGTCVIFIHGIVRSSKSMTTLTRLAEDHHMTGLEFDYPSTQIDIHQCAEYLHQCIDGLEGVEKIHFVVHSMGGLVIRAYLDKHRDPRIGRLVMLGTPNQGARMADHLKGTLLFKTVFGPAGQQLVTDPQGLIPKLPIPDFEFAIIAGARGDGKGWNPFIAGDDDGTVEVTSTRLPGAADFITIPVIHAFMMRDQAVGEHALRFLETGSLRADGMREPIPLIEALTPPAPNSPVDLPAGE
jgi:pimeloyl-ACP methyl ester carboxylesterase